MIRASVLALGALALIAWLGAGWAAAQVDAPPDTPGMTVGSERRTGGALEPPPAFPREMEVKGMAVRVRGGPGLYYYEVAKLNEPTRVTVVSEETGWSAIKPPASVVALIRKEDVRRGDADSGLVTSPAARVYARDPLSDRTWAVVAQLPMDSQVSIREEQSGYYAIAMPEGARAYVRNDYLRAPARTEGTTGIDVKMPDIKPIELDPQTEPYEKAAARLQAELEKPLEDRAFDADVVAALRGVSEKARTDYLRDAAERALATIEMQKDLQAGVKQMQADRQALERRLEQIRREAEALEARRLEQARAKSVPTFDFEGVLRKMVASTAYGYRLEDDAGRYVCLLSGDPAVLNPLLGTKVRVWGDKRFRADMNIQVCEVSRIEPAPAETSPE